MAKINSALHYSLFSWDSLDEFAGLDNLLKVIETMPNANWGLQLYRGTGSDGKPWSRDMN